MNNNKEIRVGKLLVFCGVIISIIVSATTVLVVLPLTLIEEFNKNGFDTSNSIVSISLAIATVFTVGVSFISLVFGLFGSISVIVFLRSKNPTLIYNGGLFAIIIGSISFFSQISNLFTTVTSALTGIIPGAQTILNTFFLIVSIAAVALELTGGILILVNYKKALANSEEQPDLVAARILMRRLAYYFNIAATVALSLTIIGMAWSIPMTIHSKKIIKSEKEHLLFAICCIIFLNLWSGIILILNQDDKKDSNSTSAEPAPQAVIE